MIYFISGHRNVTDIEFKAYQSRIDELVLIHSLTKNPLRFIVGDYYGVDAMAQDYLASIANPTIFDVVVYHMFDSPRNNVHAYPTVGGFESDHDRDMAMTLASDDDIAYVRSGRVGSGTSQNLLRRQLRNVIEAMPKRDVKGMLDSYTKQWGVNTPPC